MEARFNSSSSKGAAYLSSSSSSSSSYNNWIAGEAAVVVNDYVTDRCVRACVAGLRADRLRIFTAQTRKQGSKE